MSADLLAALCLMLLFEGLLLFAAPEAWKRAMASLLEKPNASLRLAGGVMVIIGLVSLYLIRGR